MTSLPAAVPPAEPPASTPIDWQQRYRRQHRTSVWLAFAAAAGAVVAVLSLVWGIAQSTGTPSAATAAAAPAGQIPGDAAGIPGSTAGGPGAANQPPGAIDATTLFAADGSVDAVALQQFLAAAPPSAEPAEIVSRLAADGVLTDAQVEALSAAIEDLDDRGAE